MGCACTCTSPSYQGDAHVHVHQMFDLDRGQTSLKTLAIDMYDSLDQINSLENITLTQEHLN